MVKEVVTDYEALSHRSPEYEVVKIFWLVGLIGSLISLLFGVWI